MNLTNLPLLKDFSIFPKHIGTWQGNWIIFDENGQEKTRFTAVVTQNIVENQWVQTNVQTYSNGQSETRNFIGTVIGEGEVLIEGSDSAFVNYKSIATERDDDLIIFRVWDKITGKLRAVETINLISPSERIRTTQSFHPETGKFRGFMVIIEQKIAE
ncbi:MULTISPECIES: hypothetical protein [Planktothrix]|uniref:hypothetical protein n=1 Tax=Planktothrix TaxID=54304 RepID=UPI00041F44E5|nr:MULTISPECIES: hypothetical protein [Planktothrix]CAD0229592.1 conserved hypothetical protein [Planktothrix agardhii]CAD5982053.1 hypothetical protein NO758_04826 [Planktothrix agardhii]